MYINHALSKEGPCDCLVLQSYAVDKSDDKLVMYPDRLQFNADMSLSVVRLSRGCFTAVLQPPNKYM